MSLLAALKLPVFPPAAPPAQPEAGVRGRDAAAFEQARKLRDGMKDQLEKGWREAVEIAKKLGPGAKKGFVAHLQEVDKKRGEARRLDGDPPGQVVVMAAALMGLKEARQAVGKPVSDGTDANTAYESADGISVEKPTSSSPAPPPAVAKNDAAEPQAPKQRAGPPPEVADLPQPMAADCKPARGRVPGPGHHLYCSTHGHVLDIKAKTIIARDLGDYKKRFPALVAANGRTARANAGKPVETVNMEEIQITGRGGTSMRLPSRAEAAKAKADAKRKIDADARASRESERKHGEVEKRVGNTNVEVSILVEGVYGNISGLKISGIATSDRGKKNVGEVGVGQFVEVGNGHYLIKGGAWLPPSGVMDFNVLPNSSGLKGRIQFTSANYVCKGKGAVVKFKAIERPNRGSSYDETAFSSATSKSYSVSSAVSVPLGGLGGPLGGLETSVSNGGGSESGVTQTTGSSVENSMPSNLFDVTVDL